MYEIQTFVNSQLVELCPGIKSLRTAKAMYEAKAHLLINTYGFKHIRYFTIMVYDGDQAIMTCTGPSTLTPEEQNTGRCLWFEKQAFRLVKADLK